MEYTSFEVLYDPSVRTWALLQSKHAIDITYTCPKCNEERAVTWLFPDTDMQFKSKGCGKIVKFRGE